jgi:NAD(P)-dependent dehydrogenase (short-subunit alcohol dehydrogenase family)
MEEGGAEALRFSYETNVFGTVKVTNAVVPLMHEAGKGKIIFMGSRSAWRTNVPVSLRFSQCSELNGDRFAVDWLVYLLKSRSACNNRHLSC